MSQYRVYQSVPGGPGVGREEEIGREASVSEALVWSGHQFPSNQA